MNNYGRQTTKDIIVDTAEKNIPKKERKRKSHWLSQKAIEIAEERRNAKKQKDFSTFNNLNRVFQNQARKDKEIYLNDICRNMEENQAKGKSRNVFQAIKQITGKFAPRMATVKDQDGKVLTEGKEIQERWKQYTQRLYSRDEKISNDFTEEEFTEEP